MNSSTTPSQKRDPRDLETLDSFLEEEGILEEVTRAAVVKMQTIQLEPLAQKMAESVGLLWDKLSDQPDIVTGHGMPEGCKQYWRDLAKIAHGHFSRNLMSYSEETRKVCDVLHHPGELLEMTGTIGDVVAELPGYILIHTANEQAVIINANSEASRLSIESLLDLVDREITVYAVVGSDLSLTYLSHVLGD